MQKNRLFNTILILLFEIRKLAKTSQVLRMSLAKLFASIINDIKDIPDSVPFNFKLHKVGLTFVFSSFELFKDFY